MRRFLTLSILAALAPFADLRSEPPKSREREPIKPVPLEQNLDARKVLLGRKLFNEPKLSGDDSISCASCHDLGKGGTDHRAHSLGIGGVEGSINAPTVFNTVFNFKQFWDGRADTLEDQAAGPVLAAGEMGSTWDQVLAKLRGSPAYSAEFKAIYPDGIQIGHITEALAQFERSLVTTNSRFDQFLRGNDAALTADEKEGYRKFKTYGCTSCHQGVNVGGNMFETLGVMADYFADRGHITKADYGRFNVTGKEEDRYVFKVPGLRNVALTAPYFHDGSAGTLEEAVAVMGKYQLGRPLSSGDVAHIVKFLNTLTGRIRGPATMRLSLKHLLVATILLGTLGWFYSQTNRVVFAEHEQFAANLRRLQQLDATVNQDVLKARFGLLDDYDGFPDAINELQRIISDLAAIPSFVPRPESEALCLKVDELSGLAARKNELLENFKSQNAVLNNSLRYLPIAGAELIPLIAADSESRELESCLNDIMQGTLAYSLRSSEGQKDAVQASLGKVAEWRSRHPSHPQSRALASLAAHTLSILNRKPRLESITREFVSVPTGTCAEELLRRYENQFAGALRKAGHHRKALYCLCVLLTVGIGYTIYAIEAANSSLERRVTERTAELNTAHQELQAGEHRLRLILETQPQCVKQVAADGTLLAMNAAGLRLIEADHFDEAVGRCFYDLVAPEYRTMFRELNEAIFQGESKTAEFEIIGLKGTRRWMATHACPLRDLEGSIVAQLAVTGDVSARKRNEAELREAQRQLVDVSRQAGMAEVASSVLHNVGNVLNSANVSLEIGLGKVRGLKAHSLEKLVVLLRAHAGDLPAFFTAHPQGSRLPDFLAQLSAHFSGEQAAITHELDLLRANVEHINEIVAMQQQYAGGGGVIEVLPIADVIEDALRMNGAALDRHGARVQREIDPALPSIPIDRHKVLQILINLIRNAKYAMDEAPTDEKCLTLRASCNGDRRVHIAVSDTGVGIAPENLPRIFEHGFTTKKEGHGFGLHSSAQTAVDLGGSLRVQSDGRGRGATFTLELPCQPHDS